MADEKVTIKIEVSSDDSAIDKTRRKLERLARSEGTSRKRNANNAAAAKKTIQDYGKTADTLKNTSRKWKKHFDSLDKMVQMMGKGLMKFVTGSLKIVVAEMVLLGAAMMLVHGFFAIGQGIMKLYRGAMKMTAGAMAGLTIAAGTLAAAMREQQAAMYAFATTNRKEFGSTLNQARVNMRMLTHDTELAAVGTDNLVAAYGAIINKTGKFNASSASMLKGLMDFASAGQDLKTGTKAAADLVGELQKVGGSYDSIKASALKLGPQMKKALDEYEKLVKTRGGKKSKDDLIKAITSGELAKMGGVEGQFAAVNSTLISMFKATMTGFKNQFADFGQVFLAPVKKELEEVSRIFKSTFQRVFGEIEAFGTGGFIDKISDAAQKVSDLIIHLTRDYLPDSVDMFSRMADKWKMFTEGYNRMLDFLRPLTDGAGVIEDMLKNILGPIWVQLKEKFGTFNAELIKHRTSFLEFGTAVGTLITRIGNYVSVVRAMFIEAMPFITKIVDGITLMVDKFTSFLGIFTKVMKAMTGGGEGGIGSFAGLAGIIAMSRKMKNNAGGWVGQSQSGIRQAANMNVTAGVVNVNGRPVASYGLKSNPGYQIANNNVTTPSLGYGRPGAGPGSGPSTRVRAPAVPLSQQRVGGRMVSFSETGRGTGPIDRSQLNITGQRFRSGVFVPADQRVDPVTGRKTVTASGRIIRGRESWMARRYGESQRHGATGFGSGPSSPGASSGRFTNWAADKYRKRLVGSSQYLGTGGGAKGLWPLSVGATTGPGSSTFNPKSRLGSRMHKFYGGSAYNNWWAPDSADPEKTGPRERKTLMGRRLQKIGSGARGIRESRAGQAVQKANRGMGAGMGASIGMGLLSQKMDPSAQGAMALGASIAMFNPLLGLAIGFGGAALNAKNAKGGAGMGAAAGAAIGSMIAPGIGTAVGAFIGLVGGGIMGHINQQKAQNKAAQGAASSMLASQQRGAFAKAGLAIANQKGVGDSSIKNIFPEILGQGEVLSKLAASALVSTGSGEVQAGRQRAAAKDIVDNQAKYGSKLTEEESKSALVTPKQFLEKLVKEQGERMKVGTALSETYGKRVKELGRISGKSEMEVENLARTMNVNLMDASMSFTDVLEKMGMAITLTAAQMKGIQTDIAIKNLEMFQEAITQLEAPKILDEKLSVLRGQMDASGGISDTDLMKGMADVLPDIIAQAGGGLQGALKAQKLLGRGGSAYSQKGADGQIGYLYGKEDTVYSGNSGMVMDRFLAQTVRDQGVNLGGFINNQMIQGTGDGGGRSALNSELFSGYISRLSKTNAGAASGLSSAVESNSLFEGVDMASQSAIVKAFQVYDKNFTAQDVGLGSVASDQDMALSLGKISDLDESLQKVFDKFITEFGVFFKSDAANQPAWFTAEAFKTLIDEMKKLDIPDTSSPRGANFGDTTSSRLARTMGRHSAMDGQLTGSRTVTSAYRTTGLGSPSSDHVMGRAYDLTGQNLGAYGRLVQSNGGFAEFHGVNGSRHLHVVPGAGPTGDTTAPASFGSYSPTGQSGTTVTNTYNISVEAGSHSANEIAEITMRKIKSMQYNNSQRA